MFVADELTAGLWQLHAPSEMSLQYGSLSGSNDNPKYCLAHPNNCDRLKIHLFFVQKHERLSEVDPHLTRMDTWNVVSSG